MVNAGTDVTVGQASPARPPPSQAADSPKSVVRPVRAPFSPTSSASAKAGSRSSRVSTKCDKPS